MVGNDAVIGRQSVRRGGWFAILLFLCTQIGVPTPRLSALQALRSEATTRTDARIDSVPLISIGDNPDEPLYGVIAAVFHGDTLILAEQSTNTLRYYDRTTGELLRTVGGRGEGPGEYEGLGFMQSVGGRLYTYDFRAYRLTVMDMSGAVERTVGIVPGATYQFPNVRGIFPDGSILVSATLRDFENTARSPMVRRDTHILGRHDSMGNHVDSLGTYLGAEYLVEPYGRGGEAIPRWLVPFRRSNHAGVAGEGYYVLDNMDPVIQVFDRAGEFRHALEPDVGPVSVTREDVGRFRQADDLNREPPEFYPYYRSVHAVAGTLWVLHHERPQDVGYRWTVFSHEGEMVGSVTASEPLWVLAVDADIAVVARRDELGVETVELRRIVDRR